MKRPRRLSKSEYLAFTFLFATLIAILVIFNYRDEIFESPSSTHQFANNEIEEIKAFAQQITEDSLKHAKTFNKRVHQKKALTPFCFDPNTADSSTLAKLGLQNWQISNLLKYRSKGGKWKSSNDFARLYGLSKEDFTTLQPYIKIKVSKKEQHRAEEKSKRDSIFMKYPKKFKNDTILQLNETDTTMLKRIPGIGSYYASKICRYRERLGGFISISQLKEIEGLPQDIEKWFTISSQPKIKKTNINNTDFKGLVRHPYLNYEQVKDICNYIRKYGKIQSLEDLSNSKNFTPKDLKRLEPYLTF